jgi:hypothetical protein
MGALRGELTSALPVLPREAQTLDEPHTEHFAVARFARAERDPVQVRAVDSKARESAPDVALEGTET